MYNFTEVFKEAINTTHSLNSSYLNILTCYIFSELIYYKHEMIVAPLFRSMMCSIIVYKTVDQFENPYSNKQKLLQFLCLYFLVGTTPYV